MTRHAPTSIAATVLVALAVFAPEARAYGPGVHLRECARLAELMAAESHALKVVASPQARPWLFLGCIAPDFRQAIQALAGRPTHSSALGLHLVQAAQKPGAPPHALAFAVGHLAHHASDGVEEAFLTPTMTAVALLGAPDLLPGVDDTPKAECETWTETLGEFPNGRMDLLIAWLEDMGLFAKPGVAWGPMLAWYAAELSAWSPKHAVQGKQLVAELQALFATAKAKLAAFDKGTVLTLLDALKSNAPATNLQVLSALPIGDALAVIGITAGGKLDPVRWAALKPLPFFADATLFPKIYAPPFADLGPRWTLDLLAKPRVDADFPDYNVWAMRAGIRISLGHGLPPGLLTPGGRVLFDAARWRNAKGSTVTSWQAGDGPLTLEVRVYATEKTDTTLVLRAHADQGGLAVDLGEVVTWTSAPLVHDPMDYMAKTPRQWLTLAVDPAGWLGKARGLVWSLARADAGVSPQQAKPFVHGRWALYQAHDVLDVWGPPYDPHQHTYSGWPRALSLPFAPAATASGSAMVVLRHGPAGGLLHGVGAVATPPGGGAPLTLDPTPGGRLLLDQVPPGTWSVQLGARPGDPLVVAATPPFAPKPTLSVTVLPGQVTVVHARATAPLVLTSASASCAQDTADPQVSLAWSVAPLAPFSRQDMRVEQRLVDPSGAQVWPGAGARAIRSLKQLDAAPPPERLTYSTAVPHDLACAVGARWQARVVYGDLAEDAPQGAALGPWASLAVAWAAVDPAHAGGSDADGPGGDDAGAAGPDGEAADSAGPGDGAGDDLGGATGDAAADAGRPKDAAAPDSVSAPSQHAPDSGCVAVPRSPSNASGGTTALGGVLALSLCALAVLGRRRRRRR